jgi:hypothetical protein
MFGLQDNVLSNASFFRGRRAIQGGQGVPAKRAALSDEKFKRGRAEHSPRGRLILASSHCVVLKSWQFLPGGFQARSKAAMQRMKFR